MWARAPGRQPIAWCWSAVIGWAGKTSCRFRAEVAPGQTIDLSMKFTAPAIEGTYQGNWQIRNDKGEIFGTTATANRPFSLVHQGEAASTDGNSL